MEPDEPGPPWSWRKGEGVPQTARVIGNRRSRVYHRPTCRGAASMSETNLVTFSSVAAAERAGYRQAGDCW
jgi:methylphosphotriester-DNA--protein-cysteine methyltransferase